MSDSISLNLTLDDMTLLLMNYRQGIKHLLGEREYIKLADDPACTTMLDIIDQKYTASMEQYGKFETLLKACLATATEKAEPVAQTKMPEIGAVVQYIGTADHLVQGRLYTITNIVGDTFFVNTEVDFVAGADVVPVHHEFYSLKDFSTEPTMQVGYEVEYIGHDQAIGDERIFRISQLQSWGGVPYICIATKTAHLSYPEVEFCLRRHGVNR